MSSLQEIKANKNYHYALVILILLLIWMISGMFSNDEQENHATDAQKPPQSELFSVRAKVINAQAYTQQLRISARTEANRMVDLRAEVSGQVIRLPIEKGSLVKTGEVICELAVEDRQLRVEESLARVDKSKMEYDAALRLKTSGFQARTVIAAKKSELKSARANLKRSQIDLEKIKIRAPFDGVVDDRSAEIGDLIQKGDICATVLDFDPLLVVGQVTGAQITQIKTNDKITAKLLTGESVAGIIRFVGSNSDNLTRTFRIEAAVNNTDNLLHSGITAELLLAAPTMNAQLISPSSLSLDDQGEIGVRILNSQSQVIFTRIKLIGDDARGIWVSGLPAQSTLITVGQEYVSHGQTVSVVMEKPAINSATPNNAASQ